MDCPQWGREDIKRGIKRAEWLLPPLRSTGFRRIFRTHYPQTVLQHVEVLVTIWDN